jgi:hypothetical protein
VDSSDLEPRGLGLLCIFLPATILAAIGLLVLWRCPGNVEGCYTYSDMETSGKTFLLFSAGNVFRVTEFGTEPKRLGSYRWEAGAGYVWTTTRGDRVRMQPHLLYARFLPSAEGARRGKAPFEWREFNVFATRRILRQQFEFVPRKVRTDGE